MNRTNRQASQQITERLAYYRTTINDLRQNQSFGGSDVQLYRLGGSSGRSPDITLSNVTAATSQGVAVTITPLATNKVAVPTPLLDIGFAVDYSGQSGAISGYAVTWLPPASGSQTVYFYVISQGATITTLNEYFTIWTFVPSSFSVSHL